MSRSAFATSDSAVVLLGGGHAHALALPIAARRFPRGRELVLVSESESAPYSGMIPGHIAGHYARDECFINLPNLARKCGAKFVADKAVGMDADAGVLFLENGGAARFGILSANTGGVPVPPPECFSPQSDRAVKPVGAFAEWLRQVDDDDNPDAVVVGGGPGGVEIALALNHRAKQNRRELRLTIMERGDRILPSLPESARRRVERILRAKDIAVKVNANAVGRKNGALLLENGESLPATRAIFATPVGPPLWAKKSGLALDENGFIRVNEFLQSESHPNVFAAGDAARFSAKPLPKSGVFAVRQGPPLARNLLAAARGEALKAWRPQSRTLAIISAGDKRAVAARGGASAEGEWVWKWKDFLDRRFMRRFA